MVVKFQSCLESQKKLVLNGVELFKNYKKGTIENPEKYHQIDAEDRIEFVAFNKGCQNYKTYNSPSQLIININTNYKYNEIEFVIPDNIKFYYISGEKFEMLVPELFYFKSMYCGEIDDELEIVMFRNIMNDRFERECKRRGINIK